MFQCDIAQHQDRIQGVVQKTQPTIFVRHHASTVQHENETLTLIGLELFDRKFVSTSRRSPIDVFVVNGYEVAKRIRQQTGGKEIVLIALTGYGQDTDRELSAQAGFDHHLVKPARLEQVKEILAAAAEQRNKIAENEE